MATEFRVRRTLKRLSPEELELHREAQRRKEVSDAILELIYRKVMEKRNKRKGPPLEETLTDL